MKSNKEKPLRRDIFSSSRELVLQLPLPVVHAEVSIVLSVVFLEVSVQAAIVAKMKPEPKALQWASIYTCEVSLCCGPGDGTEEAVSCLPPPLGGGCCVRLLPKTAWACVGRKTPRLLVQALELPLIRYTMRRASSRCSDRVVYYNLIASV